MWEPQSKCAFVAIFLSSSLSIALLPIIAGAQSRLPLCPPDTAVNLWNNCQGSFTSPNGDLYVGEFRNGLANGHGTYTSANGDKYVGERTGPENLHRTISGVSA